MSYGQANLACYEEASYVIDDYCVICEAAEIYADGVYTPRNAEDSPLYQTVVKNLETFLADQQQRDRPVPFTILRRKRNAGFS